MTQEETNRMIQLLEAQASGKQLQAKISSGKRYENFQIERMFYGLGSYKDFIAVGIESVRIKPEVKYIPYDLKDLAYFMVNGTEFLNEIGRAFIILAVYRSGEIKMSYKDGGRSETDAETMVKTMTLDGHPAGNPIEVEDEQ